MVTIPELVGKKTKKKTSRGRDVYKTLRRIGPVPKGSSVSELGVSIPLNKKKTRWLNAPSIYHGVQYTDDEILRFYKQGQLKSSEIEIIEGSVEDAVRASQKRSSKLLKRKKGGPPKPKRKPPRPLIPLRRKPKKSVPAPRRKPSTFEKLQQKYVDKAAKLNLGEEVDEAVWATHPDDTRSLALLNILKPYLKDNPLAQLGFDIVGGEEGIIKLFVDDPKSVREVGQATFHPGQKRFDIPKDRNWFQKWFDDAFPGSPTRMERVSKAMQDQNITDIMGVEDPLKRQKATVMYRDATRGIQGGLDTLIHELGHIGDTYLREQPDLDAEIHGSQFDIKDMDPSPKLFDDLRSFIDMLKTGYRRPVELTAEKGEFYQRALDAKRLEKFRGTPHRVPEPESTKGPSVDPEFVRMMYKKGLKEYPRPSEDPIMEEAQRALEQRLKETELREQIEKEFISKKGGGSVMVRNPYGYPPKAI